MILPKDGQCDMEAGLFFDQQVMGKQIGGSVADVKVAAARLALLERRYGLDVKSEWDKKIDKIPLVEERAAARSDVSVVQLARQMIDYVNNLKNLKALTRVSALEYSADKEHFEAARSEDELRDFLNKWLEDIKN